MKLSVNQIKNTEKDLISFGVTKLHVIFAHDMRKHLFIIIMALCCIQMQAQENIVSDLEKPADTSVPASLQLSPVTQGYALSPSEVEIEQPAPATYHPSPISLPWMGWSRGYGAFMGSLHPGFNVSLGASVFAPIGKHRSGGAGFSQDITAVYAMPLTNRLSLAVGGYFSNITWGHHSYRDAGVNAISTSIGRLSSTDRSRSSSPRCRCLYITCMTWATASVPPCATLLTTRSASPSLWKAAPSPHGSPRCPSPTVTTTSPMTEWTGSV